MRHLLLFLAILVSFDANSEVTDTTPPVAIHFNELDEKTLLIIFNEKMYPDKASYNLSEMGAPLEKYLSTDSTQLKLVWENPLSKGKKYTLSCYNLTDLAGNAFTQSIAFSSVRGTLISSYKKGAIIITEVMANPKGAAGLPETEYVELHNSSDKDISLSGWSLLYNNKPVKLQSDLVAKGYAVVYRKGRKMTIDNNALSLDLLDFPSALANTGKLLQLKSSEGFLIDEYDYPSAKAGVSFEYVNGQWQLSVDKRGGSPGSANAWKNGDNSEEKPKETHEDIIPNEIVFNELLPEPFTGGNEYIELYNRSNRTLSLSGLSIAKKNSDSSLTEYPLSSIKRNLNAGDFAVLTRNAEGVSSFYLVPTPEVIHELDIPVMANTNSTLVLLRAKDKTVIDEVSYSNKWHNPSIKETKGVALERIDPDLNSRNASNWTSASSLSGYGTPGYENSQSREENESITNTVNAPQFSSVTGLYEITYQLDEAGYICNAHLYDTSGQKVMTLLNNQLMGANGMMSWDGLSTEGRRIPTGIYIFYVELFNPQGGSKSYKKAFTVK
jgi:hypothetical protein